MADRKKRSRKGARFDNRHVRLRTGESQRKDGGYVYRWTDEEGRRHAKYADTLADLREKETQIVVDRHDGIKTDTNNLSVNDMFELWKKLKRGIKDITFQNYIYMYDMFVKQGFGKKKLTTVKKSDVRSFYNRLIEDKMLQTATLDSVHTVLHQVFQVAVDDNLIRLNPTDNMMRELKLSHPDRGKREALTIAQEKLLFQFLKEEPKYRHWRPVFYIMANTGMRVGEITGLTWNDVDLEGEGNGTVSVDHTLVYYDHHDSNGCYFSINTPKTKAGTRTIPMTAGVREAFLEQKRYLEEAGLECQSHIDGYSDFVFLNRFGKVMNQSSLNRVLKRVMRDCNQKVLAGHQGPGEPVLLPNFSCHILRHTFATRCAESGISPRTLMDLMGHADISTSMNIYVTVTGEAKRIEITAYENYVEKGQGKETRISAEAAVY
ncbi:MAG: site-specific integrase [Lachnospiraceae bacterium]|nr:site-specific integrase [Lachnospiraceae bacterium]